MDSNKCFICDALILSDRHQLATYKLKNSKNEICKKLGNLIGDKFVLICHETDGVCDRCVIILESIDKLEHELFPLRRIILKLLEKKYLLEKDELPNESDIKITESDTVQSGSLTFMERKRQAEESITDLTKLVNEDPRNNIYLECDTCHYTLNYPSFVERHIRTDNAAKANQDVNHARIRKSGQKAEVTLMKTEDALASPSLIQDFLDNHCLENKNEFTTDATVTDLADNDKPPSENFDCYQVFEGSSSERDAQEVFTVSENGAVESVRVVWDAETAYS